MTGVSDIPSHATGLAFLGASTPNRLNMQRIVVVGDSGSGKSTLAQALGQRLGLPYTELDGLYWGPDWAEPDIATFRERVPR